MAKRKTRLTLSRKPGEEVIVEVPGVGEICLTVVKCEATRVRLSFYAPEDWPIRRGELCPKRNNLPDGVTTLADNLGPEAAK